MAAYIGFLGGSDIDSQIFFAKHLIAASVMSAPAAIVASKILIPETKEINQGLEINNEDLGTNVLEAISIGTKQGISLAVNVKERIIKRLSRLSGARILSHVDHIDLADPETVLGTFLLDSIGRTSHFNHTLEYRYL